MVPSHIPEGVESLGRAFAGPRRVEATFTRLPEQRAVIFQLFLLFHLRFTLRRFLLFVAGRQIEDVQVQQSLSTQLPEISHTEIKNRLISLIITSLLHLEIERERERERDREPDKDKVRVPPSV